ncbi:MAG: hypothetical protein QXT73_07675 [Candidatus Methanomethylicaceae archaeon]
MRNDDQGCGVGRPRQANEQEFGQPGMMGHADCSERHFLCGSRKAHGRRITCASSEQSD